MHNHDGYDQNKKVSLTSMPTATPTKPTTPTRVKGVDKLEKLISIKADDSGNLPDQIELLQTGMWDAPYHGVFMITPQDLQQYVDNFNNDIRASSSSQGLPIDYEHDADGGAAGWITGLTIGPASDPTLASQGVQSLYANPVEWTTPGAQAVTDGVYKFISPEFCPEGYMDPEGVLDDCDNVLIGAGLTNRPLLKGLQPVAAHERSQNVLDKTGEIVKTNDKLFISIKANQNKGDSLVDLAQIRQKADADLSEDERQYLADHKAELSADEAAKFGLGASDDQVVDDKNVDDKNTNVNEPAKDEPVTTPAQPVAASDGTIKLSAADYQALKAGAEQGALAHAALEQNKATEHINSLLFNEKTGVRAKPEVRDEAISHYLSLNDKQRTTFDKLMEGVQPIVAGDRFVNQGSSTDVGAEGETAEAQLRVKANELVEKEKISYGEAIVRVASENPQLAKDYDTAVYGDAHQSLKGKR